MDIGRFQKPVRVALGGPGKIRVVTSTREAAECLLLRWPMKTAGNTSQHAARKAFEQAAAEADILVE